MAGLEGSVVPLEDVAAQAWLTLRVRVETRNLPAKGLEGAADAYRAENNSSNPMFSPGRQQKQHGRDDAHQSDQRAEALSGGYGRRGSFGGRHFFYPGKEKKHERQARPGSRARRSVITSREGNSSSCEVPAGERLSGRPPSGSPSGTRAGSKIPTRVGCRSASQPTKASKRSSVASRNTSYAAWRRCR